MNTILVYARIINGVTEYIAVTTDGENYRRFSMTPEAYEASGLFELMKY